VIHIDNIDIHNIDLYIYIYILRGGEKVLQKSNRIDVQVFGGLDKQEKLFIYKYTHIYIYIYTYIYI